MKSIDKKLNFTKDHEWCDLNSDPVRVGISDYAQHELGDVVFVDLPEVGKELTKADVAMSVESVKAVSEIYSPLSGKVSSINEELKSSPELVNQDPYNRGWLFSIEASKTELEKKELMNADEYSKLLIEISK